MQGGTDLGDGDYAVHVNNQLSFGREESVDNIQSIFSLDIVRVS